MNLVETHKPNFENVPDAEWLKVIGLTPGTFHYLNRNIRERKQRESVISVEDIAAAVEQILKFPYLGGRKGSLKLIYDRVALIGETYYKEIKYYLRQFMETTLYSRRLESELKKNYANRNRLNKDFMPPEPPCSVHQIWAIDFTMIQFMGAIYSICVVYETYSQAYLAISIEQTPTGDQAVETVKDAFSAAGCAPEKYILSDNGSQFVYSDYQQLLHHLDINELRIPPGQPWHNGALESGNRDLKKCIYAVVSENLCKNPELSKPETLLTEKRKLMKQCCREAMDIINKEIPRNKFDVTPQDVIDRKIAQKIKDMNVFKEQKKLERKKRITQINNGTIKVKSKHFTSKIINAWTKIAPKLSTEQLYSIKEQLYGRYAFMKT